jgi:hypothetical protein
MKVELLTLLTAKSMNYELSSGNHDAITAEDISHFLGTKNLDNREYDFLMAKYTDNNYARALVFDDIYEDACNIFLKHVDAKELLQDKFLVRHFINLTLRETMYPNCFICQGRGTIIVGDSIQQCGHCEGSGQFIYNDDNRPEFLNMSKDEYLKFKKPYLELLEFVKNIEINALGKIGDDS